MSGQTHTITLFVDHDVYLARHSDPTIKHLLGTDTLPTAFTRDADPRTVLETIQRLNPNHLVQLATPLSPPLNLTERPPGSPSPYQPQRPQGADHRARSARPTVSDSERPTANTVSGP